MLIYQKVNTEAAPNESNKLNILINSTEPAASAAEQQADVVLTKLTATSSSTSDIEGIVASFGTIKNKLSVTAGAATIVDNTLSLPSVTFTLAQESGTIPATTITGSISLPATINGNIHVTAVTPTTVDDTYTATTGQLYGLDTRTVKSITASSTTPGVLEIQSGTNLSSTIQVLGTSNGIVNAVVEGDNNGEIKITKNDGSTPTAIKVHGLATAAYKADNYFVAANATITGGTFCKITYDSKGLVVAGTALVASDIPALSADKITSGTFTTTRIPNLNASKITAGQFADERIASATTWNNKIGSLTAGSFITITGSGDSRTIAVTGLNNSTITIKQDGLADQTFTLNGTAATITLANTTYAAATTTVDGLMSAADKIKLNGIAVGAEVNVQSDWNQADTDSDDYIKNKPTIPTEYIKSATINDSTLALTAQDNTTINYTLPIELRLQNLVLFPATGDSADNNTIYSTDSKYNTMLGKGNYLAGDPGYTANTENLVFGGKNTLHNGVQDSATFGYRNEIYANQAFTHGYKNTNKGSESIVIGNQNNLKGTITIDDTPDPETGGYDGASSNSKQCAVFGYKNVLGTANQQMLVAGDQNQIGSNCKWGFIAGSHQNIGSDNFCVNAIDYGNTTEAHIEDCTMIGYYNHIYGGVDGDHKIYAVNMIGHDNENLDSNGNHVSDIVLLGAGLKATKTNGIVIGAYNNPDSNDYFQIGCGTDNEYRMNAFTVGHNGSDGIYLKLGNTKLTEAKLIALLAMI